MIRFKGLTLSDDLSAGLPELFKSTQRRLDEEVVRQLAPYTPVADKKYRNAGKMSRSHQIESPGVIVNTEPKARREYYTNMGHGEQGVNSVTGHFGQRGKYWLERMKADHKTEIRKRVWGK